MKENGLVTSQVTQIAQDSGPFVNALSLGSKIVASRKKRFVLTAIKCAISGSLIYWILRGFNLSEIFSVVHSGDTPLLLLAFSLNFVSLYVSAYRWRVLLNAQGIDVPLFFLLKSCAVGVFFNNFLPSTVGGDAMRAYDSWQAGKNKAGAVAVIFVDRFLGLLALMLFALGAVTVSKELTASLPFLYLWLALITAALLLFVWIVFLPSRWMPVVVPQIRLSFWPKLRSALDKFLGAFVAFQGKKDALAMGLGLSMILQANVVMHYYFFARGLNLTVPLYNFFLIVPLVVLIMTIPVSINAIGVREHTFAFFFAAFGVSKVEAIALAWLVYGVVIFQGVLGGIIYALRK
jgi:glycosyltransferase 2 family protein